MNVRIRDKDIDYRFYGFDGLFIDYYERFNAQSEGIYKESVS